MKRLPLSLLVLSMFALLSTAQFSIQGDVQPSSECESEEEEEDNSCELVQQSSVAGQSAESLTLLVGVSNETLSATEESESSSVCSAGCSSEPHSEDHDHHHPECKDRNIQTIDGSCNNVDHPCVGARNKSPFRKGKCRKHTCGHHLPHQARKARVYSDLAHFQCTETADPRHLSDLHTQFGLFIRHDTQDADTIRGRKSHKCKHLWLPCWDPWRTHDTHHIKRKRERYMCCKCKGDGRMCDSIEQLDAPADEECSNCVESSQFVANTSVATDKPRCRRYYVNARVTSWLDGSVVYGSREDVARELRTGQGGLLKTQMDGRFPPNQPAGMDYCMKTVGDDITPLLVGDYRGNEMLGLLAMHTLWVREHNWWARKFDSIFNKDCCDFVPIPNIAGETAQSGDSAKSSSPDVSSVFPVPVPIPVPTPPTIPTVPKPPVELPDLKKCLKPCDAKMNDEALYQMARMVVRSELQYIYMTEYLPALLGDFSTKPYEYTPEISCGGRRKKKVCKPQATYEYLTGCSRVIDSQIKNDYKLMNAFHKPTCVGVLQGPDAYNPKRLLECGLDPFIRNQISRTAEMIDLAGMDSVRSFGKHGDWFTDNIFRTYDFSMKPYLKCRHKWLQHSKDHEHCRHGHCKPCKDKFDPICENDWNRVGKLDRHHIDELNLFTGMLFDGPAPGASVSKFCQSVTADHLEHLRSCDRFWFENKNVFFSDDEKDKEFRKMIIDFGHMRNVLQRNTDIPCLEIAENPFFVGKCTDESLCPARDVVHNLIKDKLDLLGLAVGFLNQIFGGVIDAKLLAKEKLVDKVINIVEPVVEPKIIFKSQVLH